MSSTETCSSPRSATSRSAASCSARRGASFLRSRSPEVMPTWSQNLAITASLHILHGVSLPVNGGRRDYAVRVIDAVPVTRPTVLLRPHPHGVERLFTPEALATLSERYRVVELEP